MNGEGALGVGCAAPDGLVVGCAVPGVFACVGCGAILDDPGRAIGPNGAPGGAIPGGNDPGGIAPGGVGIAPGGIGNPSLPGLCPVF